MLNTVLCIVQHLNFQHLESAVKAGFDKKIFLIVRSSEDIFKVKIGFQLYTVGQDEKVGVLKWFTHTKETWRQKTIKIHCLQYRPPIPTSHSFHTVGTNATKLYATTFHRKDV